LEDQTQPVPQPGQPQPASARPKSLDDAHVDDLLRLVVEKGGSDLHIAVGIPPIIRVDGQLLPTNYEKVDPQSAQRLIYDILTDEQIQRFETNFELDFSYTLARLSRFRVNVYRDRGNVAMAFRVIPARIPTLRELSLPPVLEELTRLPRGLILVTGPTGSGKSTSLAAMINQINSERSVHILTIEDPIEYLHSHRFSVINQREVGQDTRTFANALRAALREDPDVILVGEMRDLETMQMAVSAAETGHLVFATLHTNSAATSVERIVDSFPPGQQEQVRLQLSNVIEAVFSMRLVPGKDGKRLVTYEVMLGTSAIKTSIREGKTHQIDNILQTSTEVGMNTMEMSLASLVKNGSMDIETAQAYSLRPEELMRLVRTSR
jgi:twitching motility protein PilT